MFWVQNKRKSICEFVHFSHAQTLQYAVYWLKITFNYVGLCTTCSDATKKKKYIAGFSRYILIWIRTKK